MWGKNMLKKILFILLSANFCCAVDVDQDYMAKRNKAFWIVGGVICGTTVTVVAAPFVLPAATITMIQAGAVAVTAKIAATSAVVSASVTTSVTAVAGTTIGTAAGTAAGVVVSVPSAIGLGIKGATLVRPYVFETEHEENIYRKNCKMQKIIEAQSNLISCLIKNKSDNKKGSFDCSPSCQEMAYKFRLLAGQTELQKAIKSI